MGRYLYYIIALVTAGLMFLAYFLVHKKAKDRIPLVHKLVAWGIFILMFVWMLFGSDGPLRNTMKLVNTTPLADITTEGNLKALSVITLI